MKPFWLLPLSVQHMSQVTAGTQEAAVIALATRRSEGVTRRDIAEALGVPGNHASSLLSTLCSRGELTKVGPTYRAK